MIAFPECAQIVQWIDEATGAGARGHEACERLGIALRTLQRWRQGGELGIDARTRRTYGVVRSSLIWGQQS